MFRKLSGKEEQEYRQWVKDNWNGGPALDIFHPVIKDEINKQRQEIKERKNGN